MSLSLHKAGITECRTQLLEMELIKGNYTSVLYIPLSLVNCLSVVPFVFEPSCFSHTVSALCLFHRRLYST
jgi:hypothetical protein